MRHNAWSTPSSGVRTLVAFVLGDAVLVHCSATGHHKGASVIPTLQEKAIVHPDVIIHTGMVALCISTYQAISFDLRHTVHPLGVLLTNGRIAVYRV